MITAKALLDLFDDNVYEAVNHAQSLYGEYPEKPDKPTLRKEHTSSDIKVYNKEYEKYETALSAYKTEQDMYRKRKRDCDDAIEEYIKELSGFNKIVPESRKNKVWFKAWEDGHSSGYTEVYGCLCNLVDLFED